MTAVPKSYFKKSTKLIEENDQFKTDFIDLISGKRQGTLGLWRYNDDPIHPQVSGSYQWEQLVENATSYYVSRLGDQSILNNLTKISEYVGSDVDQVVDFGPGKVRPTITKFLNHIIPDGTYIPVDVSEKFLFESYQLQDKKIVQHVRPIIANFVEDELELPSTGRRVFLFLGSTIGNIQGGERTDPEFQVRYLLSRFYAQMKKGDILIIGYDSCMDGDVVLNCYNDPYSLSFITLPLYRALYELKPIGGFDPSKLKPEIMWHQEVGQCAHTVVVQEEQRFIIDDRIYRISKGERLILSSSYKFRDKEMENYLTMINFEDINIIGNNHNLMRLALVKK